MRLLFLLRSSLSAGECGRRFESGRVPRREKKLTLHPLLSSPLLLTVPLVDFGDDADPLPSLTSLSALTQATSIHSSGRSTARLPRLSKLQRFLQNLALKPSGEDPGLEEVVEDLLAEGAGGGDEDDGGTTGGGGGFGSVAFGAGETLDAASASASSTGAETTSSRKERLARAKAARRNPEVDSFAYIEMLLEALAALGKLGYALDAVGQRVQGEMFALVEGTVEEVEERCASLSSSSCSSLFFPWPSDAA